MGRLATILEYTYAGDSERKKILKSYKFPTDVRELVMSEDMEEDTLVNIEIQNTIVEGAKSRSVIRKVLPIININTYNTLVPYDVSPSGTIDAVGEIAAVPTLRSSFSSGSISPNKYSTKIQITDELLEDHRWDLVEIQVKRAGALLENTLNKIGMNELLCSHHASAPSDIDPTYSHIQLQDLARAKQSLQNIYWGGGGISFIGHPAAWRYLYTCTSGSNYVGSNLVNISPNNGDKIIGMDAYELDTPLETGAAKYWDATDSANHYYGIVLDSNNYAVIGMQDDIHVTRKVNDPVHDLTSLVASAKFDVKVINNKAAVRILAK